MRLDGNGGHMFQRRSTALLAVATLVAATLLAGCREEEQGRVLRYEKGTYLGQKDSELTEEQRNALRARAQQQRGQ